MLAKFFNNKDLGILLLRLFVGARLLYGVVDNVFSRERMTEFTGAGRNSIDKK